MATIVKKTRVTRKKDPLEQIGNKLIEELLAIKDNREQFLERYNQLVSDTEKEMVRLKETQAILKKIGKTYITKEDMVKSSHDNIAESKKDNIEINELFVLASEDFNSIGINKGTTTCKSDIVKTVISYIKSKNLYCDGSKTSFNPDDILRVLLGEKQEYSIYSLLRLLEEKITT